MDTTPTLEFVPKYDGFSKELAWMYKQEQEIAGTQTSKMFEMIQAFAAMQNKIIEEYNKGKVLTKESLELYRSITINMITLFADTGGMLYSLYVLYCYLTNNANPDKQRKIPYKPSDN